MSHDMLFMECHKLVKGLDPVADAFDNAAAPATDIVSMKDHDGVAFIGYIGVGATGTQTLTVEACSDTSATSTTAIAFWYREILTSDTAGTITRATTSGFTTTAGSSKIWIIEVRAEDLAASGYSYVRVKQSAEPVNSPCLGGILICLFNPRFQQKTALRTSI